MKVLIAVDGSAPSDKAAKWYLDVHRDGNEVILCYVTDLPAHVNFGYQGGTAMRPERYPQLVKEADHAFKNVQQKYTKLFHDHSVEMSLIRMEGDPGHCVCKLAKDKEVNLVVVGTRGQGLARRTMLGSVSDYILHHSHVPVTVCQK